MNDAVLEEIKARVDLVELVSSYGIAVRHAGGSAKACCPFHHEKTPSFNINASRGFYHCFGCGESGDAIKFVQKMEGLTFMEAVKKLAEPLGIQVKGQGEGEGEEAKRRKRLLALMAELAAFYHRCLLKTKEAQLARDYLKTRDLNEETCEQWTIGYAPKGIATILKWAEKYGYTMQELVDAGVVKAPDRPGDSGYHRFGGRLMFSIRDRQGRVVAFSGRQLVEQKNSGKYVNSPETLIFKKSNVLFGFDKAAANIAKSPHREAIACEGQIDTIRLHLSGFPVAVASQGTAFTDEHARMLKRVCDSIVLAYDDDGAGHKATVKVGGMMLALEVPVRVVRIPDGDDPDSFLRTKGAAAFQALIDAAESIVSFQVRSERAKESDPKSIDAVARVSRAVVATIAMCPSAILRASLVDEASKLLGLPAAALTEEVEKAKASGGWRAASGGTASVRQQDWEGDWGTASVRQQDWEVSGGTASVRQQEGTASVRQQDGSAVHGGEDAADVAPPPMQEMALMTFLFGKDNDAALDGMVGEFLPPSVFAHDFTRRFVEAWHATVSEGVDHIATFRETLRPCELPWLDQIMAKGGLDGACGKDATEILQALIRRLWQNALKRRRGALPAVGDAEAERTLGLYSRDIKQLDSMTWNMASNFIHAHIAEGF